MLAGGSARLCVVDVGGDGEVKGGDVRKGGEEGGD